MWSLEERGAGLLVDLYRCLFGRLAAGWIIAGLAMLGVHILRSEDLGVNAATAESGRTFTDSPGRLSIIDAIRQYRPA
jgi:hypothetical protein